MQGRSVAPLAEPLEAGVDSVHSEQPLPLREDCQDTRAVQGRALRQGRDDG